MKIQTKQWLLLYLIINTLIVTLTFNYLKINHTKLKAVFIDVGQGDSALIITPQNQKILIDGGPTPNLGEKLSPYFSFFDKKIDLVILTHPDSDHLNGLIPLIENYSIQQVILPLVSKNNSPYEFFLKSLQDRNITYSFGNSQTDIQLNKDTSIDFLYPFPQSNFSNINNFSNPSLIFKIKYKEVAFLFSGDTESKEEKIALISPYSFQANLYQVGHHGSKTSSSSVFLQSIQPQIAIISSENNNKFGHPHLETLKTLEINNIKHFNTARVGDIGFYSDGTNLKLLK